MVTLHCTVRYILVIHALFTPYCCLPVLSPVTTAMWRGAVFEYPKDVLYMKCSSAGRDYILCSMKLREYNLKGPRIQHTALYPRLCLQ